MAPEHGTKYKVDWTTQGTVSPLAAKISFVMAVVFRNRGAIKITAAKSGKKINLEKNLKIKFIPLNYFLLHPSRVKSM